MRKYLFSAGMIFVCSVLCCAEEDPLVSIARSAKINGYIQGGYSSVHNDVHVSSDTFSLRRVRVGIRITSTDHISGYIEGDLKQSELMDGYITYTVMPWLGIRFGQMRIPLGAETALEEAELDFIEYSRVVDELVVKSPGLRDIGLTMMSDGPFWYGSAMVSNGEGAQSENEDERNAFSGRCVFFAATIKAGGSWYIGDRLLAGQKIKRRRYGAELQLGNEEGFLKGEYLFGRDDTIKKDGWTVTGDTGLPFVSPMAYHKIPLRFLVRFEQWDPDKDIDDDSESRVVFGIRYPFSEYFRGDLNYTIVQEETEEQVDNDRLHVQVQLRF